MRLMTTIPAGRIVMLCGTALLLVSCSGEPSASDISKALNGAIEEEQNQMKNLTAGLSAGLPGVANPVSEMMSIQITDLEKIGCKESGEKAYVCDVRYTAKGGLFGKEGRDITTPIRMVKASDGWAASAR
ncbi:hypothetical protein [Agrobacterium sp. Azo12]|uniref:hypothetical protein n=1 Tax=Agrobacterium sp. Azo12 TaxID=3031129 RepID=UPI0023D83BB2|nr:hypothetical protein [Agrobacterium sp. Azo12]MDO5898757.1 hypothetical protein [Agrobacterium sp. Azo12]